MGMEEGEGMEGEGEEEEGGETDGRGTNRSAFIPWDYQTKLGIVG